MELIHFETLFALVHVAKIDLFIQRQKRKTLKRGRVFPKSIGGFPF
jgi:hypothetical protein